MVQRERRESYALIGRRARNGFLVRFTSHEKEWDDGQVRQGLVDCRNDPGAPGRLLLRHVPSTLTEDLRRPERPTGLRSPVFFSRLHSADWQWSHHRRVRFALNGPAGP